MDKSNIKRNKRTFTLLFLTIVMIITNFNFFPIDNDSKSSIKIENFDETKYFQEKNLRTANSIETHNNTSGKLDLILHQSKIDEGASLFEIINASDSSNNSFYFNSPSDKSFNSTTSYVEIANIYAPNKTIIIEDDYTANEFQRISVLSQFLSFNASGLGYIENITLRLKQINTGNPSNLTLDLYSASTDLSPDQKIGTMISNEYFNDSADVFQWHKVKNLDFQYNSSDTNHDLFYIRLDRVGGIGLYSDYTTDLGGIDTDDECLVYQADQTTLEWYSAPGNTVDLPFIIDFYPLNNTPKPKQIGLKINNTNVKNINGLNKGTWNISKNFIQLPSQIDYVLSADWWDVSCNITKIQVNYTKDDLKANSSFRVLGSGQIINWNATAGNLTCFDSNFEYYWINFTVPTQWSNFKAFNDTIDLTDNTTLGPVKNGYKQYQIYNTSNGPNWYITAESQNLLSDIKIYVNAIENYVVNSSNTVRFNASFTEIIKNGNLNLSVYSPIPRYLNHTNVINISQQVPNTEFNVTDWNIFDNEIQYGVFTTRMAWNNDTAVGFLIGNLTILGDTELIIEDPQSFTFDASTVFNITVFFNDTGQNKGISSAEINYSLNGGLDWRYDNIDKFGNGRYNITIDCNDTNFTSNGKNSIIINSSKTFHNNQSETVNITIIGETSLTIIRPPNESNFDSSETFNITIKFNNTLRNEIIANPMINYSLDGGNSYRWDNITSIGNNRFNITVFCNDVDFGNYSLRTIIVNTSKQYYHNQSRDLNITITGVTKLTFTKLPDKSFYYSDEVFNITAYYFDNSRNQELTGATIEVEVEGEGLYDSSYISEIGNGNYSIMVNCSEPIFDRYGKFNLRINGSKQNYYEYSNSSLELIIGNATLEVLDPSEGSIFIDRQTFNITIQYTDVVKNQGIISSKINYTLNGGLNWRYNNVTEIGNGRYNITIDCNDTQFLSFGFIDIKINASKQNYNNLSTTFSFHRQITTVIDPSNSFDLRSVIRGLNVSYTFNYSDNEENFIVGASWNEVSLNYGFISFLKDLGKGNYTMYLNTSNVNVAASPFTFIFNISAIGNETQVISLDIDVTIIQTKIEVLEYDSSIARFSGLNQSVNFYFNDTVNNQPISDLTTSDIEVRNNETGALWDRGDFNWALINPLFDGNYTLNISTNGLDAGWYTLKINASKFPNYGWSLAYLSFYLRGDYTQINMISVSDLEQQLTPIGLGYNYTTFLGSDLSLEFNITDLDDGTNVTGVADQYIISYKNLGTLSVGTIPQTFSFIFQSPSYGTYSGNINTSVLTSPGYYLINITVVKLNYENTTFSFNLTLVNSRMNMVSLTNVGGILKPKGIYNIYNSSIAVNIYIEFNITDTESLNRLIARAADSYTVRYQNIGTGGNGILSETLGFNNPTSRYNGSIVTSGLQAGNYIINVSVSILNYDIFPLIFNLTIVSTNASIINITNPGGQLSPSGVGFFYETTIALDIDIEFNITDATFGNVITIGAGIIYEVSFENLDTLSTGTIIDILSEGGISHSGTLDTSQFTNGNYTITIIVNNSNSIVSSFSFNLRIVLTSSNIISVNNLNGQLTPSGIGNFYVNTITTDIVIEFNTTDVTFGDVIPIGIGISYTISYLNLDSLDSGTISNSITEGGFSHSGTLTISLLESGNYTFTIIINKSNIIVASIGFNLSIILAKSNLISVSDPSGQLAPTGNYYETYIESDIDIEFNITDYNFGNITLLGVGTSYMIFYENINTLVNGTILHTLNEISLIHIGTLDISQFSSGNYSIIITINKSNNVVSTFSFNLLVKDKDQVRISIINQPSSINAGKTLKIVFKAEYYNGVGWLPLTGANLRIVPYFDGVISTEIQTRTTNSTGEVEFEITVGIEVTNITLRVEILSGYFYTTTSLDILDINVIPYSPGFALEDFLPYLIIIGAAVALVGSSIGVYRGVVVPKKREKARVLNEVKT
ncbi:hypothetical protein LCGC14_1077170, partial [marine sediment metagenome]